MNLRAVLPALLALLLAGCLASPVASSGGIGSVTVRNSSPSAIIMAAQRIFPSYGYTPSGGNGVTSVTFDKNSSKIANVLWGSYGDPQTLRVKVRITAIPGTPDYRISPVVYTVSDAGEAGFESKRALSGLWNGEFSPIMKRIAAQAADQPGY
jgi:hypothetical protein